MRATSPLPKELHGHLSMHTAQALSNAPARNDRARLRRPTTPLTRRGCPIGLEDNLGVRPSTTKTRHNRNCLAGLIWTILTFDGPGPGTTCPVRDRLPGWRVCPGAIDRARASPRRDWRSPQTSGTTPASPLHQGATSFLPVIGPASLTRRQGASAKRLYCDRWEGNWGSSVSREEVMKQDTSATVREESRIVAEVSAAAAQVVLFPGFMKQGHFRHILREKWRKCPQWRKWISKPSAQRFAVLTVVPPDVSGSIRTSSKYTVPMPVSAIVTLIVPEAGTRR
jgi:hypothetical protein